MVDRGILFSTEMVRAILDGRKTQTRRVIKNPQRLESLMLKGEGPEWCPYGKVGGRLYIRESHKLTKFKRDDEQWVRCEYRYEYEGDGSLREYRWLDIPKPQRERLKRIKTWGKWRPPRFMYKFLARIYLEITNIRVERVQDISKEDAKAEGCNCSWLIKQANKAKHNKRREIIYEKYGTPIVDTRTANEQSEFAYLWDSINAKRGFGWDKNPWVWVIEFKRLQEKI